MVKLIVGFLVGVLVLPVLGYFYIRSGMVPVATAEAPFPFEARLAGMALHARIERDGIKQAPMAADEAAYVNGAHLYRTQCAVCHGLPGSGKTTIASGMFPQVPQLFEGHGVTDDPAGETYWKIANGIRLSGMPAYAKSLSVTEMWQISLLLANADKLPSKAREVLQQPLGVS